ncbi:hypothetical protein CASFOL_036017 [Castilleja foliolosa]|uniref:Uncharacterized protein n=1 Tax=Castilleja foliolosa TaxID=1961234 RepID=A0ABD3BUE3_9LAMI
MAWRGTVSRSFMSAARASSLRPSTPLLAPPRLRPSSLPSSRPNSRPFSFSSPRTLGELGYSSQSVMPLYTGVGLTSRPAVNLRAFCELSHVLHEHIIGMGRLVLDDLGTCSIGVLFRNFPFGEKVENINKRRSWIFMFFFFF